MTGGLIHAGLQRLSARPGGGRSESFAVEHPWNALGEPEVEAAGIEPAFCSRRLAVRGLR
jgi:hypothetical protein